MCMGKSAVTAVKDYETSRNALCVNPCPTTAKRSIKEISFIREDVNATGKGSKSLLSRNIGESEEPQSSTETGGEPTWGNMPSGLV